MADHHSDNQRRRLLQAGASARSARRNSRRGPVRGTRARHVRLEEVQGREDRSVPGEEPARRSPHQVPQGIRGHDGHHRRLRDDSRAAAAAEGGDRVQLGQAELRRHRDLVSRAEAAVRQEQVDGGRASARRRQVDHRSRPRLRRFREERARVGDAARRARRQPPAQHRPVDALLQQGALRREGHCVPEELRRDDRRRGAPQRSGEGRERLRRARPQERERAGVVELPAGLRRRFHRRQGQAPDGDAGRDRQREDVPDAAGEDRAARCCGLQLERVAEPVRARQGRDVARRHRLRRAARRSRPSRASSARSATA